MSSISLRCRKVRVYQPRWKERSELICDAHADLVGLQIYLVRPLSGRIIDPIAVKIAISVFGADDEVVRHRVLCTGPERPAKGGDRSKTVVQWRMIGRFGFLLGMTILVS